MTTEMKWEGAEKEQIMRFMREVKGWAYAQAPWLAFEDFSKRCDKLRSQKCINNMLQEMRKEESERYRPWYLIARSF